jgi:uncharacterized membrane protein YgaE (UPF0421/DUF939 family)
MQVTINVKDRVLLNVIDKMVDRSNNGIDKYSTTLEDDKSGLVFFLKQIQTELMDATLYLQRLKEEITNLREEKALLRELNDIDVIDAFIVEEKKKLPKDLKKFKKNLKEKLGRGDNIGIKKFPSVNDLTRYSLGHDYWYTVEIDD